jgi:carbon-monoxide dehydrogenase large subunit
MDITYDIYKSTYIPRVVGNARYLDDLKLAGLHHVVIVRSPYPHARIKHIDATEAYSVKGVKAIVTGSELKRECGSLHVLVEAAPPNSKIPAKYPLAVEKTTYQGEAVAAVVAGDLYAARDAAELVEVEYEPLQPVLNPIMAMSDSSSIIHPELGTNVAFRWVHKTGEPDKALRDSGVVISDKFRVQRVAGVAMEPRGAVGVYDRATEQLTIWSTTHRPHALKTSIAEVLGHPENKIRVIAPYVGGSFGSKTNTYPEEVLVAYLAKKLDVPVKWVATRSEDFISATHGRDIFADVTAGFDNTGRLLRMKCRIIADMGAYWHRFAHAAPINVAKLLSGCYKINNFEAEVIGVYTNKMATHVYRGTGRPEAAYIIEKIMDRAARRLNIDPAEIRKNNFVKRDEFPYRNPAGFVYDSGDYEATFNKAIALSDYTQMRREQEEMRKHGKLVGIGIISYVEVCSVAGGWEYAEARVEPTGKITLLSGISPHGQATDVVLRKVVAEELGVDPVEVEVVTGDTAVIPYGWGSVAARSLMAGGSSALRAARALKERLLDAAAVLLETSKQDLEFGAGKVYVKGSPDISLTIAQIVKEVYAHHGISSRAQGISSSLNASDFYHVEPSFPHGAHICMVEVDPDTGAFKILKYIAVDDCGRIMSRPLAEGQIVGGIATGLAQVWLEEICYNQEGVNITSDLTSYTLPTAIEVPQLITDFTEVPSRNALGAKGAGESGVVGAMAALANAIEDALSPLGIELNDLPYTSEKIWRAVRNRSLKHPNVV